MHKFMRVIVPLFVVALRLFPGSPAVGAACDPHRPANIFDVIFNRGFQKTPGGGLSGILTEAKLVDVHVATGTSVSTYVALHVNREDRFVRLGVSERSDNSRFVFTSYRAGDGSPDRNRLFEDLDPTEGSFMDLAILRTGSTIAFVFNGVTIDTANIVFTPTSADIMGRTTTQASQMPGSVLNKLVFRDAYYRTGPSGIAFNGNPYPTPTSLEDLTWPGDTEKIDDRTYNVWDPVCIL